MNAKKLQTAKERKTGLKLFPSFKKNLTQRLKLRLPLWKPKTASMVGGTLKTKASKDLKSWNICTSCRELLLGKFIEISDTGNMALLDKDYDPKRNSKVPPHILLEAWGNINMEYTQLMDSGKIKRLLSDGVDNEVRRLELEIIMSVIKVLNETYDSGLVKILNGYGYKFKFDHTNKDTYYRDLNRVITLSKNRIVSIREKDAEMQRLMKEEDVQARNEEDSWTELLITLSDDAGYPLDRNKITVYEFCVRHKNLLKKMKMEAKSASKLASIPKH